MNKGKVLAIDYGTKRVGIATGDLELKMAFPRTILNNKGNLFNDILELVNDLGVKLIMFNEPL